MKPLAQVFCGFLAGLFFLVSSHAATESQVGRDFNHTTTGFLLSGGHATAACETCHAGGVFKGTPRNCDGCHALGRRVVATPKSSKHIPTDAPCESCHFNTATFLGARFNHGTVRPGQCGVCHNGRQATGRPVSHNTASAATASCDQCHRTMAWIPASWNHVGVVRGTCTNCHNGSLTIGKPGNHTTIAMATYQCDECHGFIGWLPARYKHNTPGICSSCHNGAIAAGKPASHQPASLKGTSPCDVCHKIQGWLPATYTHTTAGLCANCHDGISSIGKPASHGAASMKGMDPCEECHRVQGWLPATYMHPASGLCGSCHDGVKATGKGAGHISVGTSDCGECHLSKTTWAGALGAKPATHIPYNAGVACNACHIGATVLNGSALHAQVGSIACYTCHGKNTLYPGNGQTTASWPNFHKSSKNPSATDCSASGCHRPAGTKGVLYVNWD